MIKRKMKLVLVLLISGGLLLGVAARWANQAGIRKTFLDAVEGGDLNTVQKFLSKDPRLISIRDNRKKAAEGSPLELAIRGGHVDIVKLLLSRGANPNERNPRGTGPLHWAAKAGRAELVEVLVRYGSDVNGRIGEFNHPPLCFATSTEVTEALIANGADISLRDKSLSSSTPLHSIAGSGQTEAAEVLLAHGADIEVEDSFGRTPLHRATRSGRGKMVELLIAKGANINAKDSKGLTTLNLAIDSDWGTKLDRKDAAKVLISHGAKYTIRDVAWLGDVTRVGVLLEENPALANDTSGLYKEAVLFAAIRENHADVAGLLLAKGAEFDVTGRYKEPPLHAAVHAGHKAVIEVLLEKEADVNQKGAHGELALHWAAAKGHAEVVKLLLERGSQVNVKTEKQRADMDTIMRESANLVKHQLKCLELYEKARQATLAGRGLQIAPPPRLVFAAGDTPLHSAAQWGREDIVKMLLSNGAEVDAKNHWGQKPLHYACVFRHKEIAEMLLGAGADANAKDNDEHTPLVLASSPKDAPAKDIVEMLLAKGAQK